MNTIIADTEQMHYLAIGSKKRKFESTAAALMAAGFPEDRAQELVVAASMNGSEAVIVHVDGTPEDVVLIAAPTPDGILLLHGDIGTLFESRDEAMAAFPQILAAVGDPNVVGYVMGWRRSAARGLQ